MRKLTLIIAFILCALPASAQLANTSVQNGNGAPAGACVSGSSYTNATNGESYTCAGSIWVLVPIGSTTGPIATVSVSSLTGTQSITTLCAAATCVAGQYRIDWTFWGSGTACSSVTAGQVTLKLNWTDSFGTVHNGPIMLMNTQTTATTVAYSAFFHFETALANEGAGGIYVLTTNGAAAIQYTLTYTACTTGTGTYNFSAAVSRLQ